jgi:predicted metal-dependent hydrolase
MFYTDGETFRYRGNNIVLRIEENGAKSNETERVRISDGCLVVRAAPEERRKSLVYWYTAETEKIARALVPEWSKKLGVRPRAVVVKYAKTRWGSCSSSGRIFFNSRLSMLSDDVAEYVVVHELCHMKQMNHGPSFWREVSSALPDAMNLRRALRQQELSTVL